MPVKILNKPEAAAKAAPAKAPTAADLQKDGRRRNPTKRGYPAKVFAKLLDYVASGQDLTTACKNPGMPTPWTVRRRMEVDDVLADAYKRAQAIRLHGLADQLVRLPDEALEGISNVSAANRLTQTKLKQDAIEFLISKGLAEYRGGDVGEATQITLNIVNSPDAPPAAGTPAAPYTPPGTPVLKIVGGADNG